MAVDITQFHQVFFEESFEGLDVMERELMKLDPAHPDAETINTIFRAAHSIKGGSGTFGFKPVAEFTHGIETLLDRIRAGEHAMAKTDVDLLLESVDCLRDMFVHLRDKTHVDVGVAASITERVNAVLAGQGGKGCDPTDKRASVSESESGMNEWQIYFKPSHDIFKTGNEPQRLFRELAKLGSLAITVNADELPPFEAIQPDECYLSWRITLNTAADRSAIEEVFEWVADESLLEIHAQAPQDVHVQKPIETTAEKPLAEASAGKETKAPAAAAANSEQSSIRVGIDKIDSLINMVGELVITQSMLSQLGENFDLSRLVRLQEGLSQLEQNTRELQESVMRIRMLPISFAFSRFPRMVRDMTQKLGKKIDLVMLGEATELDKTVMEKIGDPLVHLVRNSVDHGIESVEARIAAGKSEAGRITLNAFHQGGNIIIQISDDGAGLNADKILRKAIEKGLVSADDQLSRDQIHELIFMPGFSTADVVSDISGRGVGMDVVKRNIRDLGGAVDIESSPGKGSTFTVRLPLTLAILDGQLVRVGQQIFILPLVSIVESLQVKTGMVNSVGGGCDVLRLRNEYIPIVRLYDVFNIDSQHQKLEDGLLVVVESGGEKMGLLVDDLQAQQQVVIKSLEQNYQKVEGISGATILGDGTVALILDIDGIVDIAGLQHQQLQDALTFKQQKTPQAAQVRMA